MHDVMMYCVYVHAEPHILCCERIYVSSSRKVSVAVVVVVEVVIVVVQIQLARQIVLVTYKTYS